MNASGAARACTLIVLLHATAASSATLYISANKGSDLAIGTKDAPLATLQAALGRARNNDTLAIAEGAYAQNSVIVLHGRLTIQGGWSDAFDKRDAFAQPSRITSNVPSQPIFDIGSQAEEIVIDGVQIEGSAAGFNNSLCNDCLSAVYSPTLFAPLISVQQSGRLGIRNVVFVNAPGGGIRADILGSVELDNVAFVNQRPFAVSASASCGYASPVCGELALRNASILWTWREAPDESSGGGSAVVVGAGVRARIERSVIAYSDKVGIELAAGSHEAALRDLVLFDNRRGDLGAQDTPQLRALPIAAVTEAFGVSGKAPFGRMERLAMPWDQVYLQHFLSRSAGTFYGTHFPANRAFMISPASDAGLRTPPGSQYTYALAVTGGKPPVAAVHETEPVDAKKKAKPKKRGHH